MAEQQYTIVRDENGKLLVAMLEPQQKKNNRNLIPERREEIKRILGLSNAGGVAASLTFLRAEINSPTFYTDEVFSVFSFYLLGLGAVLAARLLDYFSLYNKYSDGRQDNLLIKLVVLPRCMRRIYFEMYRILMFGSAICLCWASWKGYCLLAKSLNL